MPRLARRAVLAAFAATAALAVPAAASADPLAPPTRLGTLSATTDGSVSGDAPVLAGSTRFFAADDGDHGREPFAATGAGAPGLLADIAPGTAPSDPIGFAVLGGAVYFAAADSAGAGLWRTDGTPAGTARVVDLTPDADDVPDRMVASGGRLFIHVNRFGGGRLVVSDGTAAGTSVVGSYGASGSLSAVAGGVAFTSDAGGDGDEPWFSDGTPAGTVELLDVAPGPQGSFAGPMVSAGGLAFFAASGDDGRELYRTDGTPGGTFQVTEINPSGSAYVDGITAFGGQVLFTATNGSDGIELWGSDGTPGGTAMVADIAPGADSSYPGALTASGGEVYFAADDHALGMELYKTDGTASGTVLVDDLLPGPDPWGHPAGSMPGALTAVGGEVYFSAASTTSAQALWRTDGTAAGTVRVADVPNRYDNRTIVGIADAGAGLVAFSADDGDHGLEPWISDGTAAGTVMIDLDAAGAAHPFAQGVAGGKVYVSGRLSGPFSEHEPVATDGTAAGTARLGTVTDAGAVTRVGARTVFVGALPDRSGYGLWRTDGTSAGTQLITTAVTVDVGYRPTLLRSYVQELDGEVYFRGTDDAHGTELWRTDGTAAGTALVADLAPGIASSDVSSLGVAGGKLVFSADDGAGHGSELWASDGTAGGTAEVKDVNSGSGGSRAGAGWAAQIGRLGAAAYFLADDGSGHKQLWKTDATATGTVRVADLGLAAGGSQQPGFTAAGGRLFFAAADGSGDDVRLWSTDGTAAGTREVGALRQGAYWQQPFMAALDGVLLYEPGDAPGLWATRGDGTASERLTGAGVAVGDTTIMAAGGRAYFAARDDAHGVELWSTDGTTAGTRLESDLRPGVLSSRPLPLGALGGTLVVAADRPGTGTTLEAFALFAAPVAPADPVPAPDPDPPAVDPAPSTPEPTAAAPVADPPAPKADDLPKAPGAPKAADPVRTAPTPAAPAARKVAATLSLVVAKKADDRLPFRYVVSGTLKAGAASACAGTVTVTLRRGDVVLSKVVAKLGKDCSYRATLTKADMKHLPRRAGTLAVDARFAGTATVRAARSAAVAVRYGR